MISISTETALYEWRFGQIQAERLVSEILHIEGYEDVDPQHPLGGPDGLKDVICRKNGNQWVAAAFFPPTKQTFKEIEDKFTHDFAGVKQNEAYGFIFFVNQPLTVSERLQLIEKVGDVQSEIFHLERLRSILDSPKGCGIRLQYLRIPMSEEEQWAFWNSMNFDIVKRLIDNEARYDARFRNFDEKLDIILARTSTLAFDLHSQPSHLVQTGIPFYNIEMPTSTLNLGTLCWLHRLITEESNLSDTIRGRFRSVNVWIGSNVSTPENATFVPPPPENIINLLNEWVNWWTNLHIKLHGQPKEDIVFALAEFHHSFLKIHPFLDGNGRLARVLLDQAARELLNQSIGLEFLRDPSDYLSALQEADKGNLLPLQLRIFAALE